jgi:hypothetical protein
MGGFCLVLVSITKNITLRIFYHYLDKASIKYYASKSNVCYGVFLSFQASATAAACSQKKSFFDEQVHFHLNPFVVDCSSTV